MASRPGMQRHKQVPHPHQKDVFGDMSPDPEWIPELAYRSVYEHWNNYWSQVGESGSTNEEAEEALVGVWARKTISASASYLNKAKLVLKVGKRNGEGNEVRVPNPKAAGMTLRELIDTGVLKGAPLRRQKA